MEKLMNMINEQLLLEKNRRELISKSVNAEKTKSYGTTRYARRTKQSIASSVKSYNKIDMNALFKGDILSFKVPVHGETDDYEVELLFEHFMESIQEQIKRNNNKLEFKVVVRALMNAFNKDDVYISCTCPDWKYRFSYNATKDRYNSGKPELRPANITNPGDTKGAGCKHSMLVLANLGWVNKVASVIHNYINYTRDHMEKAYTEIIFPVIYGMKYDKALQLGLFDSDELANTMDSKSTAEIDKSNKERGDAGKYKKGGDVNGQNSFRFTKNPNKNQAQLDLDGEEDK